MQQGHTGEAEWCPEASSRGDAKQPKQPRRCAGRQAGAHRRGEDSPLTGLADLKGVARRPNPKLGKNRLTAHALTGLQRGLTMYDSACNFGARNS